MALLHLTDENFDAEVLRASGLALVDFWATWCAPCKKIAPILEELSQELNNKIKIGKLNVEEGSRVASQYGIMSVPTLLFFKQGKVVEHVTGVVTKHDLKHKIEEHLK